MTTNQPADKNNDFRKRAEYVLSKNKAHTTETISPEQIQPMLHDLLVHQVELEMQNDELRRIQHELEVTRARYFSLYDLAPVGYLTVSEQGLIFEANLTLCTLLGVERNTLLNKPISSYIFREDQDCYYLLDKRLAETGLAQCCDLRMLKSDGSTFWAHLQAVSSQNGEKLIALANITELKLAQQELIKKQKTESLGIMAAGIAHDFNNILTAIMGNISLTRLQLSEPEQAKERLKEAEKATFRARELAKQLITFSKGGKPVKKIINVRVMLKEAAGFALLGSNVKCVLSLANELWSVEADEGQIIQVIHNLVLNAIHAMPDGGTVTLSAENVIAHQSGKKYVKFSVADTGTGISEPNLLKIFDPYFTTKKSGNGLGLATCYSIIKKHGGKIRTTSIMGKGSAFSISLPASEQQSAYESVCGKAALQ